MGFWNRYPYTDFHELNLDWIIGQIINLKNKMDKWFLDITPTIINTVNKWLDDHPEATTTVQDDSLTSAKFVPSLRYKIDNMPIINIASMIDEDLDSSNIADAVALALDKSKYIYIPAGDYTCNIEISRDCTIYMDDECYIATNNSDPAIYAHDCSINLIGGKVYAGEDNNSRVPVARNNGIIFFENCTDSSITDLYSPWSKYNGVIWIKDCTNFIMENCNFRNMLRAALFIWGHCINVTVRNCKFYNSRAIDGEDYCYFVYTGAKSFSETFIPVDGLIYENNYGDGSDDCGLDTHGAKNVIIRNNTILNTVCAITAYNDNSRVTRPSGWKMENIMIENNYCESDKQIPIGSAYPHPFLFLGSTLRKTYTESPDNYSTFEDFTNCIIKNNIFKTPNNYSSGAIFFNNFTSNLIFENNIIELRTGAANNVQLSRVIGFRFAHNKSVGTVQTILYFGQCFGEISENIGFRLNYFTSRIAYVKGLQNNFGDHVVPQTVSMGDYVWTQDTLHVCNQWGINLQGSANSGVKTFNVSISNGIAEVDSNVYIPNLALELTGDATVTAYVDKVMDLERMILVDASYVVIPDGEYTATIRDATIVPIE